MKTKQNIKVIFVAILISLTSLVALCDDSKAFFWADLEGKDPTPSELHADLEQLRDQLNEAEGSFNAYESSIAELSLAIGDRLAEQGNHTDALVSYRRSHHVTRINEGLSSPRQIPVLERILLTHTEVGDEQEAIITMDKISDLYTLNYSRVSPELVAHLNSRGSWYLAKYSKHTFKSKKNIHYLIEAHEAFDRARSLSQLANTNYNPEIYRILGAVNYAMADHLGIIRRRSLTFDNVNRQADGTVHFVFNSYNRGRNILKEGRTRAEKYGSQEDVIQATMQLADWEQVFLKRNIARSLYLDAYQQLKKLSDSHPMHSIFAEPKLLPAYDIDSALEDIIEPKETTQVSFVLDVNDWGASRNVRTVPSSSEVSKEERRAARSATRLVQRSVFRPLIIDGLPTEKKALTQTLFLPI